MATNDLITRLILQTKEFDGNLQRSQKEMQNFQKEISAKVGDVSKGFSSAIGVVGKLAPAIGIAAGGIETFKKVIFSTQETQDTFNRLIEQGKTAIDTFFESVARADFSNFTNTMNDAITAAGNFYDALDKLQTRQIHSSNELKALSAEEARVIRDIDKTKLAIAKSTNDAEKEMQKIALKALESQLDKFGEKRNVVYEDLHKKAYNTFSESLKTELREQKIYDTQVLDYIKTVNQEKLAEDADYYKKQKELAKGEYVYTGQAVGQYQETEESKRASEWLKSEEAQRKKIAFLVNNHKSDLKETLEYLNLAYDYQVQMYQAESRIANKQRETIESAKSGIKPIVSKVDKQKELYQSYNLLIAKVEEFRVAMAKAAEVGDTAGLVYWRSEMEKAQAKIDELKKFERDQAKGNEGMLSAPAAPVTKKPDISAINEEMKARVKANNEIAKSEHDKAMAAVDAANIQREATYGLIESAGMAIEMNDMSAASFVRMVAKVLPQIASLVAAKNMQTVAETTSSGGAAGGVPGAIAGLAVGLGLVASILSATTKPKFAGGGIVGDQNLVRINSGEMILNHAQQTRLFNSINSGQMESGSGSQVEFVIRGENLIGVQKNYNSKFKKKNGNND